MALKNKLEIVSFLIKKSVFIRIICVICVLFITFCLHAMDGEFHLANDK